MRAKSRSGLKISDCDACRPGIRAHYAIVQTSRVKGKKNAAEAAFFLP